MTKLRARRGGWSKNIKENDSSDKTSLRSTINRILHSNLKIYSKPISHRDIKANHATPDPLLGRRRPCDGHEPRPRVTGSNPRGDAEAVQSCSGEFIFFTLCESTYPIHRMPVVWSQNPYVQEWVVGFGTWLDLLSVVAWHPCCGSCGGTRWILKKACHNGCVVAWLSI